MVFSKRVFLLILALWVGAIAAMAQLAASMHGTVLDPSGAAIPKATVTVTGPNSTVKVGTTDDNGAYTITGLPAGSYTVRVMALGFNLLEKTGVAVAAGRPMTFDARLTLETSKQEVTVSDTQQVELDPSKNAGALVLKQEDLDMLSDDPDDLQADLLALAGPAAGPNGGQIFIDGFSNGQLPPKESIREIRINSNPFSAEFDTQGRGRIEIFTKPGSEKFHGTVNLTYSDHVFDARNPYITSPSFPIPASDSKNLQANLSGPIIKGKMSFFVDFSRREQRLDSLINAVELNPSNFTPLPQGYAIIAPNTFNSVSPRLTYQLTPNISLDGRYSWHGQSWNNQGVSGFNLPSTAATQHQNNQSVNLIETQIINASTINESRFQYSQNHNNSTGVDPELNISVADAFTTGSSFPMNHTWTNNFELQNYTSITHGTHFLKFGARLRESRLNSYATNNFLGQFNFASLASYTTMLQGIQAGMPLGTIIANGGGPTQFDFNYGQPQITGSQFDAGLFYQDDWKIKPNITLSLGLRYEVQQNIPDHGDWAPRVGLAWGIGPSQGRLRTPKTVLRAGIGYFYDRFSLSNFLNTQRYNGINQLAYVITDPNFFVANPTLTSSAPYITLNNGALVNVNGQPLTLQSLVQPQYALSSTTYHLDSAFQSPRQQQAAIGIDRQLPKNMTVSLNYINSRGTHVLRNGVNINTPLPGTYVGPGTGLYPLGSTAGIYDLIESDGYYKQSQLITNMNARVNSRISLFGYYAYGHADTNVNGTPSNPYNLNADWGHANYDIRHRVNINGSILGLWGVRLSPNITYNSAPPWGLYEGVDQFGDGSVSSARPAFEPAGYAGPGANTSCTSQVVQSLQPCVAVTAVGKFIANPPAGLVSSYQLKVVPENYFRAYGQFNFNLRISRTWGFGESTASNNQRQGRGGGPGGPPGGGFGRGVGGGGPRGGGPGPGGPGGMFGGDSSGKRYTLTAGLMFHNMFNNVNPGGIESNLLSPRLGEALSLANVGGFGGNGFAQAFNRRIDLTLRFSF
jgi:hypothetical protein